MSSRSCSRARRACAASALGEPAAAVGPSATNRSSNCGAHRCARSSGALEAFDAEPAIQVPVWWARMRARWRAGLDRPG